MTASLSPAAAYILSTLELRKSTDSIMHFIQEDPNNQQRLRELQSQRDAAYQKWTSAAAALKALPLSELPSVMRQINEALGY